MEDRVRVKCAVCGKKQTIAEVYRLKVNILLFPDFFPELTDVDKEINELQICNNCGYTFINIGEYTLPKANIKGVEYKDPMKSLGVRNEDESEDEGVMKLCRVAIAYLNAGCERRAAVYYNKAAIISKIPRIKNSLFARSFGVLNRLIEKEDAEEEMILAYLNLTRMMGYDVLGGLVLNLSPRLKTSIAIEIAKKIQYLSEKSDRAYYTCSEMLSKRCKEE